MSVKSFKSAVVLSAFALLVSMPASAGTSDEIQNKNQNQNQFTAHGELPSDLLNLSGSQKSDEVFIQLAGGGQFNGFFRKSEGMMGGMMGMMGMMVYECLSECENGGGNGGGQTYNNLKFNGFSRGDDNGGGMMGGMMGMMGMGMMSRETIQSSDANGGGGMGGMGGMGGLP